MHIESIKLTGFKSFRSETILKFPGAITAIVGPNGSGKSNVADAFRWVLGEQSLKTIRSQEGTDVIFSGSKSESRLSRAEVLIRLNMEMDASASGQKEQERDGDADDNDEDLDSSLHGLSEIEMTRKIYANGDASYLLNRSAVRLLDIQLFLAGHNVGQKNYAVIGQGMIDAILKESPKDRIDFFYEATGVKKYQIKLHKAELKLESSKEKLEQSQALLKEITPHKNYLERQAEKYIKRNDLLSELSKKQKQYYRATVMAIEQSQKSKREDFGTIEAQHQALEKDLESCESKIDLFRNAPSFKARHVELQEKLKNHMEERASISEKINDLSREKENRLESQGEFDTAFLYRRLDEVRELSSAGEVQQGHIHKERRALEQQQKAKQQELFDVRARIGKLKEKKAVAPEALINVLEKLLTLSHIEVIKKRIKAVIIGLQDSSVAELTESERECVAALNDDTVRLQILAEKERMYQATHNRYKDEIAEIELKLKKQKGGLSKEFITEIEAQGEKFKKKRGSIESEITKGEEALIALTRKEEESRTCLYEMQKHYQELSDQRIHINGLMQAVKIDLAKLEVRSEQLMVECIESLGASRAETILAQVRATPPGEYKKDTVNLKRLRREIKKLEAQFGSLGEVEESVIEEYKEIKERFDFLNEQTTDLEQAISSLQKICRKLRRVIKKRFQAQLKRLNSAFGTYFKLLFKGGSAGLEQVEITDHDQPGIQIVAHPPGKKIKHTAMLSGGERSLVSVALICAIISSNPPPFVILDEIDAALDEENSHRLADILGQLAKKTQFIIITHNRTTMEIADILYGVTMDQNGVSRLVGVKLEDWE